MNRFSYTKQNVSLNNFFAEVDESLDLTTALDICGAKDAYLELKEENKAFNDALNVRTAQKANNSKFKASEVAKSIEMACNDIFQLVEVMNRITPSEDYQAFINEANIITNEFVAKINIRKGKHASEAELQE